MNNEWHEIDNVYFIDWIGTPVTRLLPELIGIIACWMNFNLFTAILMSLELWWFLHDVVLSYNVAKIFRKGYMNAGLSARQYYELITQIKLGFNISDKLLNKIGLQNDKEEK